MLGAATNMACQGRRRYFQPGIVIYGQWRLILRLVSGMARHALILFAAVSAASFLCRRIDGQLRVCAGHAARFRAASA